MRHLKIIGSLAVAAAALLALAGSASATTLTSPTGTVTTGPIHFVSEEKAVVGTNHILIHNETANFECNSTLEWQVASHGAGVTAEGLVSNLQFTNCTGGLTFEVLSKGSLVLHWTSGYNGTLTSSGMTIRTTLHLGIFGTVECRYITNNTHIGTITGGNPATLHIEAKIPFHGGSGLCGGETASWTGAYKTTGALYVDP